MPDTGSTRSTVSNVDVLVGLFQGARFGYHSIGKLSLYTALNTNSSEVLNKTAPSWCREVFVSTPTDIVA